MLFSKPMLFQTMLGMLLLYISMAVLVITLLLSFFWCLKEVITGPGSAPAEDRTRTEPCVTELTFREEMGPLGTTRAQQT